MKFDWKWLLVGIPLLAIAAIAILHSWFGGLAPAPPMAIPDRTAFLDKADVEHPPLTVLAPSDETNSLPPGAEEKVPEAKEEPPADEFEPLPIPELSPETVDSP